MGKGRDKELIRLRDEALCRRYYYWTEVQRLRFDDALRVSGARCARERPPWPGRCPR